MIRESAIIQYEITTFAYTSMSPYVDITQKINLSDSQRYGLCFRRMVFTTAVLFNGYHTEGMKNASTVLSNVVGQKVRHMGVEQVARQARKSQQIQMFMQFSVSWHLSSNVRWQYLWVPLMKTKLYHEISGTIETTNMENRTLVPPGLIYIVIS